MKEQVEELAGGTGVAVALKAGERVFLRNTFGSQVVDTWAVSAGDPCEYLSVEHTRRMNGHLYPGAGETFWSNRRNPMLVMEEDSFPGTHDMLVACCDSWLYRHYGCPPGHANCHDNFLAALAAKGIAATLVPNPVNLWMNVPVVGNDMTVTTPLSRPGDHVLLAAQMDLCIVFSACPMDVTPINGADRQVRPVHYAVRRP
ncbi:MAG: urea carboxylase-associated family protein [Rhodospirillales bacterium]